MPAAAAGRVSRSRKRFAIAGAVACACIAVAAAIFAFGSPSSVQEEVPADASTQTQESGQAGGESSAGDTASSVAEDTEVENADSSDAVLDTAATEASNSAGNATDAGGANRASGTGGSSSAGTSPSVSEAPAPLAPESAPAPTTITVSVSIDSSRAASYGYPASMGGATVTLPQGSSVYDALCAVGVSVGGSSSYVSSIGGLAEFACGKGSGWMYSVDGVFPGKGCGSYKLSGGERIVWVYTCDMGNDL